jgi:hypothetical protein
MVEKYTLEIATPKGIFIDEFPKTTKIQDVIKDVIEKQDLPDGDAYEVFYKGEALKPEDRPLVSFKLEANDEGIVQLEFVATGSGV